MKVLVACEESQRVCAEFRRLGHEAYSCDIQECSGGHPEWHIQDDALAYINGYAMFYTADGKEHCIPEEWDLLIAHPPCTYLSNVGATRLCKVIDGKHYVDLERLNKGLDAKEFFMNFFTCNARRIAIENPIPSRVYRLPKYSQIIQPYEHGHPYSKKTCLWLKGLPKIQPTDIVTPSCSWVMKFRDSKQRSKTFPGIARAMAEQWGGENL